MTLDGASIAQTVADLDCKKRNKKGLDNWRLVGKGVGIHWPELDEDISVSALLK